MRDSNGRFAKHTSGNRGGRPLKYPEGDVSLLAMLSEVIPVKQNGVERELTTEEAMLLRAAQEVLKRDPGVRTIRIVLKAIGEREIARHIRASPKARKEKAYLVQERDSDNAFEAMCLLGIAQPNPDFPEAASTELLDEYGEVQTNYSRIQLMPWAVTAGQRRSPAGHDDPDWSMTLDRHTAKANVPD